MLKILGRTSSINVRKVLWACDELNLPYQQEDWGGGSASLQQPEFLALNPNALIPVIVEDDFVLWESNVICRYLANNVPHSHLLPSSARQRALVEQWMDWQAGSLADAFRYLFKARVRNMPANPDPETLAASERSWNHHMEILARQLEKTGAYVTGTAFTLADIVLGLSVHRWLMTPMTRPDLPAITDYYDLLRQRPAFAQYATQQLP